MHQASQNHIKTYTDKGFKKSSLDKQLQNGFEKNQSQIKDELNIFCLQEVLREDKKGNQLFF